MTPKVEHQPEQHRFVITQDHQVAELVYEQRGSTLAVTHTGVPPALEHHGLGSLLAEAAIAYAQASGLTIEPRCEFMAAYMQQHPESRHLLAQR